MNCINQNVNKKTDKHWYIFTCKIQYCNKQVFIHCSVYVSYIYEVSVNYCPSNISQVFIVVYYYE